MDLHHYCMVRNTTTVLNSTTKVVLEGVELEVSDLVMGVTSRHEELAMSFTNLNKPLIESQGHIYKCPHLYNA